MFIIHLITLAIFLVNFLFRAFLCAICIPIDLFVVSLYGLLRLKRWIRPPPRQKFSIFKDCKRPVMVMIHGSGSDSLQFILAQWLLKEIPMTTIDLIQKRNKSIVDHAEELGLFLDYLHSQGTKSVVLLGVSMGGLVASWYAEHHKDKKVQIRGIVTIGTPFQGAPLLNICIPKYLLFQLPIRHLEMTPGSRFLHHLAAKQRKSQYQYLTIGSEADLHVPNEYSCSYTVPSVQHVTLRFPAHIALTAFPPIFVNHVKSFYDQVCKS